jgi:hypothetical protein
MPRENEHFEDDLGIAAFLVVKGFKLLGLAPGNRGHYSFRFEDASGGAMKAAMNYLRGESVSARDLLAAEKSLKTFLYNTKGSRNGHRAGNSNRSFDSPRD